VKLNEGITVVDTRFVGKFRVVMMTDGRKIRSAVLIKDRFEDFSMRDHDDVRTLWKLSKKYRGGEITETKQNEGHEIINLKDILSEGWTNVKFDDIKVGTKITYQMKVVYIVTKLYPGGFMMKIYKSGDNPGMFAKTARIEQDNYESQVKTGFIKGVK